MTTLVDALRVHRWLFWTLAALLSWGVWAVLSKFLGNALSAEQIQALSTLGLAPILLPLALSAGTSLRQASRKGLGLALVGGVVTCLGNIPYYGAVARGEKFATVVSLTALAPLVTVLLALFVLRERLNRLQVLGLGLSLVAIWLFNVREDGALLSPTIIVALLPILLWGLSGFLQKVATNHASGEAAALVYLAAFVPVGLFYALHERWPNPIAPRSWLLVIGMGFFLAFGNFAVIAAYARQGKAAVIAPVVNLYPLISVSIALLLGETVEKREVIGIVCALASVAALSCESAPIKPEANLESERKDCHAQIHH